MLPEKILRCHDVTVRIRMVYYSKNLTEAQGVIRSAESPRAPRGSPTSRNLTFCEIVRFRQFKA
jgi:hypothetical protein